MAMTERQKETSRNLKKRGFTPNFNRTTGYFRPRCDQCEVLVINGVACHEIGCPNARKVQHDEDED